MNTDSASCAKFEAIYLERLPLSRRRLPEIRIRSRRGPLPHAWKAKVEAEVPGRTPPPD